MCKQQERIDELELEISQIHKNYAEALKFKSEHEYNEIRIKWHPWQIALVPIGLGLLGVVFSLVGVLSK
ncbi:hypothetical protein [Photobacterium profundum]|uniref:hypothetical protein n=1 Tax=Photobacterium profundum TaxID=74109 RepID=UPI0002DF9167|nr:hypothetical protein [Photobacterium profundum]